MGQRGRLDRTGAGPAPGWRQAVATGTVVVAAAGVPGVVLGVVETREAGPVADRAALLGVSVLHATALTLRAPDMARG